MPGQFWVRDHHRTKKKNHKEAKEKCGFLFAFTLPVPLFTLRIYILSTLIKKAFEVFYRHKQWENGWKVSPHCPFYPQSRSREKTQLGVSGHWWYSRRVPLRHTVPPCYSAYYLTLVSSLAFRIFYPKSQQSTLKAASLYPKIIISYSSKLEPLCIQWRRQKKKRSQII